MEKGIAFLRIQNDFKMLSENPISNLHYDITINDISYNSEELYVMVEFLPKVGLFIGEYIIFRINFPYSYPFKAPSIICCSNFLHPNIEFFKRTLSIPILENWNCIYTIKNICEKLSDLFIMLNDNTIPKNPFNENLRKIFLNNKVLYKTIADKYFQGKEMEVQQILTTMEHHMLLSNNKNFEAKIETQEENQSFSYKRRKPGGKYDNNQNKIKKS